MSIDIATEIDLDSQLTLDSDATAALFLDARTANNGRTRKSRTRLSRPSTH